MKVTWADIGCPEQAGQVAFKGGVLTVRPNQIAIWNRHPEAKFTLVESRPLSGPKEFVLGSYELPDGVEDEDEDD